MIPVYAKLGQEAKDLFEQNYNIGFVKIDVKNSISSGLSLDFSGICNSDSGQVSSSLLTKYDFSEYGFLSSAKWTTDNDLITEVLVNDKNLLDGFRVSFHTKYAMVSGKKSGMIKTFLESSNHNLTGDIDFENGTPCFHPSGVYKFQDLLVGSQAQIDLKTFNITKQNFAVGYQQAGLSIAAHFDNFKEINVGIYKKVNPSVERGIQLNWDANNNARLALGCQHVVDSSSLIKAKINNSGQIGCSYIYQYRPGVRISISTLLDAKNLMAGGHKLGIGLTFQS